MSQVKYKLLQPMLGWTKGEQFVLDTDWGIWTRQRTGESFTIRGSVAEGEINLLLGNMTKYTTFMERINE